MVTCECSILIEFAFFIYRDRNWGFLRDYDYYGNLKEKKQPIKKLSYYDSTIPSTTAGTFGSRVQHPDSLEIMRLEKTTSHKKRRTDLQNYMCN